MRGQAFCLAFFISHIKIGYQMKSMHSLLRQNAEIAFEKTQLQSSVHARISDEIEENVKLRDEKTARLKAQRLAQAAITPPSKTKKSKPKSNIKPH